jgi:hypothetical protein
VVTVILTATNRDGCALQETWELDNATMFSLISGPAGKSAPYDLGFSFDVVKFTTAHLDTAGNILASRSGTIDEKSGKIVPPPDFGNQALPSGPSLQMTSTSGAIEGAGAVSVQSYTISTQESDITSNGQFPVGHASISFLSDLASPGFLVDTGPDGSFGGLTDALLTVPANNWGMGDPSIESVRMSNIAITSYETSWSFGEAMPQDTISLDFTAEQMTAQGIYPDPTSVSRSVNWDFRARSGTDPSASDFGGQHPNLGAPTLDLGTAVLPVTSFKQAPPDGFFPNCFTVTVNHGLASPDLFLANASSQILDHMMWRGYDSQGRLETWTLHSVGVTSFRTDYVCGGAGAGQDTFTLGAEQATLDVAGAVILGAPAHCLQGIPISLTSQVKTVAGMAGLHYTWTVTINGQPAANGPDAPTFNFVTYQAGTYVIGLSVQDAYGEMVTAVSQTIQVQPIFVLRVSGPANGIVGQDLYFSLNHSDDLELATAKITYTIQWGDGSSQTVQGVGSVKVSHSYTHSRTYEVQVTGQDEAGMVSLPVLRSVQIIPTLAHLGLAVPGIGTVLGGVSGPVSSALMTEPSTNPFEPKTDGAKVPSDPVWRPKPDGHGDKRGAGHAPKRGTHSDDKLLDELFRSGDLSTETLASDLALALQASTIG